MVKVVSSAALSLEATGTTLLTTGGANVASPDAWVTTTPAAHVPGSLSSTPAAVQTSEVAVILPVLKSQSLPQALTFLTSSKPAPLMVKVVLTGVVEAACA